MSLVPSYHVLVSIAVLREGCRSSVVARPLQLDGVVGAGTGRH